MQNVASNSNSQLPLHYRFAATWGSHEGSLLLWTLMLASWTLRRRDLQPRNLPRALRRARAGVMGLVSPGFLLFLLLTSNPFERLLPAAAEGRDLNPLLQDPGHGDPSADALHGLRRLLGRVRVRDRGAARRPARCGWARWSRPWTTVAWCFLTLGIALGSCWAYYELGWGGWWFWDPVENASFMPWLDGTALIHSLAVTEKRGAFKSWTVLLAIVAFSLSLLGTFLVRSGVLTSVHAFATDPARGVFILVFLAHRHRRLAGALRVARAAGRDSARASTLVSRESMLLANNVLLRRRDGERCCSARCIRCSSMRSTLGKISVGPPYFDAVFFPLMAPAVFLMGVGPLARWQKRAGAGARAAAEMGVRAWR